MTWAEHVDPADHSFHKRTDDPYWNESSFMSFRILDHDMSCMIYHYFRPNQNTVMGGPVFWDATGADHQTCLHSAWDWHMPIPEGADMFHVALPNGLTIETIEPQKSVRYRYDTEDCSFDLRYEAQREPYYHRARNQGVKDLVDDSGDAISVGHYDQYGLVNGVVQLGDRKIDVVDARASKDHSWGPRILVSNRTSKIRIGYISAVGSLDNAFHVWSASDLPWDEDPVEGTTENVVAGYYLKDGVYGEFVDGTRKCLERGDDGRPLREVIEATDDLGRSLHAEGTETHTLRWPGNQAGQALRVPPFGRAGAYGGHPAVVPVAERRAGARRLRRQHLEVRDGVDRK